MYDEIFEFSSINDFFQFLPENTVLHSVRFVEKTNFDGDRETYFEISYDHK